MLKADNRSPLLDNEDTSARRRSKRCYHRVISGLEKGGSVRLITLTTSKVSDNARFQSDFRKLRMRLLRRKLLVDYIRCPEYTKSGLRHEHILFRGSYIEQSYLSYLWEKIHSAPVVDIRRVWGKHRMAGYLASYMAKAPAGRYAYSWGWVWKGFAGSWKDLKAMSYWNCWTFKELLTIWRWSVKLDRKTEEVFTWLLEDIRLNAVSAVEAFELVTKLRCSGSLGSICGRTTRTG